MDLTIIKIGGSVITHKNSNVPSINQENLELVAQQLKSLAAQQEGRFLIIHGVGSYGHPIVKATGIHEGIREQSQVFAFAQTQKLQNELNCIVVSVLQGVGIPAFPCQISNSAVMENGRLLDFDLTAIKGMLDLGIVPVGFGVPAYDRITGCSILSGDQSAPYFALKLKASRIIVASDVGGIYSKDPKTNADARLIRTVDTADPKNVESSLGGSIDIDVTGGMRQKYLELAAVARAGIPSQIVLFSHLAQALGGANVGTTIADLVTRQKEELVEIPTRLAQEGSAV